MTLGRLHGSDDAPWATVIGLDSATGLQAARILASGGVRVLGIASSADHWACRTRSVARVVEVDDMGAALLDALDDEKRVPPGSVLLPCSDQAVLTIARSADRLAGRHRFSNPPLAAIESLLDKTRFIEVASSAGVRTPRSLVVTNTADIHHALSVLEPPLLLKPAVKHARWLSHAPDKVIRVDRTDDAGAVVERALGWADSLVVQEWIEGPDSALITCNCYVDPSGRSEAAVVSVKLRQWPPSTGTASAAVTVHDPEVAATTERILASVGFHGLGYVEYKRSDGGLVAIEANVGRPTGRSAMAEAAGVPMHMALYLDLAGVPRERLGTPAEGVVWMHFRRDLQAAMRGRRRHELTLRSWATSLSGRRVEAVGSWRDPVPFVADFWSTLAKRRPGRRRLVRTPGQEDG